MLNIVKSGFDGKLLTAFTLAFLLFTSLLFSQNTFRLGYTGSCYDFELRTGDFGLI